MAENRNNGSTDSDPLNDKVRIKFASPTEKPDKSVGFYYWSTKMDAKIFSLLFIITVFYAFYHFVIIPLQSMGF